MKLILERVRVQFNPQRANSQINRNNIVPSSSPLFVAVIANGHQNDCSKRDCRISELLKNYTASLLLLLCNQFRPYPMRLFSFSLSIAVIMTVGNLSSSSVKNYILGTVSFSKSKRLKRNKIVYHQLFNDKKSPRSMGPAAIDLTCSQSLDSTHPTDRLGRMSQ